MRALPRGKRPLKSRTAIHPFCSFVLGRSLWNQPESLYQPSIALGLDMGNPGESLPAFSPWLAVLPKMAVCALDSILMPIIQMKMSRVTRKHLLEKENQSGPEARRHCLPTVLSVKWKLLFFLRGNTVDKGCHSRIQFQNNNWGLFKRTVIVHSLPPFYQAQTGSVIQRLSPL